MRRMAGYGAIVFGLLFLSLSAVVMLHASMLIGFDHAIQRVIAPFQHGVLLDLAVIFTNFGSTAGIVAGLLVVLVLFRHRPDVVTRLMIALLGVSVSGEYLKTFFHRMRPEPLAGFVQINSYSFPSGHSYSSVVLYGFIALLLWIHAPTKPRKWIGVSACVLGILMIGGTRILLQYHYPSDVLGGYLGGAFWLCISLAIPLNEHLYHWNANRSENIDRPVL